MKKLLILMGVLSIMLVAGCSESVDSSDEKVTTNANTDNKEQKQEKETTKKENKEEKKETKKEDKSKLTLKKFNKIKTNMTYDEVVKILGVEGEVMSESEVAGIKTVLYTWDGSLGVNMNATFQNDKMISKAQVGLE